MLNSRTAKAFSLALLATLAAVTGCCPCPPRDKTVILPPPLTLQQQVSEFNARARVITNVSANGNVKITWIDKSKSRTESTDATVRIRQRFGEDSQKNFGGDFILFGRVLGKEMFQVGKNPIDTWFLVRLDTNTAWVTKTAQLANSDRVGPSRADLMLNLLGITELPEAAPANAPIPADNFVIQRFPENSNQVELLVFSFVRMPNMVISTDQPMGPDGRPFMPQVVGAKLDRCITIDRVTNLPSRVTTYDAAGLPIIVANLTDYREAPLRDGDKYRTDALPPKLPYHVVVEYVRDGAKFELSFNDMYVPLAIPARVFTTPNFAEEGLKVQPAN